MRHRKNFNHLGRQAGHRKAMLANMASSLILHKRITTTTAKAKALKIFVEPLITKSKDDTTHARRVVFSYLQSKEAVTELFREVSPKIADRPGGYTRILKTGVRLGDSADMCVIELVDYNENLLGTKDDKAKSGRRRRRGGAKKTTGDQVTATAEKSVEKTSVGEVSSKAAVEETATEAKAEDISTDVAAAEENNASVPEAVADAEPAEENKTDEAEDSEEKKAE